MGNDGRPRRTFGPLAQRRLAQMEARRKHQIPQQGDQAYRGSCAHCAHTFVVCHPLDKNSAATEKMPPMVGDLLECDVCECQMRVEQVVGFTIKVSRFWIPGGMEA